MIWLESLIILACIMIGARKNGVAMGFAGGVGLCLLVFIFGLRPSSPPVNVLLIITAVSAMAATLQCAGGLDLLVAVAEKNSSQSPGSHHDHGADCDFRFFDVYGNQLCGNGCVSGDFGSCS